jgi:hypothetical protein
MRGISVYERDGRPVYYVAYDCPRRARRVFEATPFRTDNPEGKRRAYNFAIEKAKELAIDGSVAKSERWETWVLPFLEHQYRESPLTLRRYKQAWKWLSLFFIEHKKCYVPRAVTYGHAREYHMWRTTFKKVSGRTVANNTALLDIKAMSVVLDEAVKRAFAPSNPWLKVGIRREKARSARELSVSELALIETKLPDFVAQDTNDRGWMPAAYAIARYQGCRLRETRLDLRRHVNLRDSQITFHTKGHKDGDGDTTAMHPKLRPLFERMISEKRQFTLDYGPRPSLLWRKFFDSIGLKDAWFHCLRSTVITEMARNGVPISQAMRYVLHASEEIHRAYQRLNTGDLTRCVAAIGADTPQSS